MSTSVENKNITEKNNNSKPGIKNSPKLDAADQEHLTILKDKADLMGIKYHPNIGLVKLKTKIDDHMEGGGIETEDVQVEDIVPVAEYNEPVVPQATAASLRKDASRLVRVIVSTRNPLKAKWGGEVFTVANDMVGTLRKYVPFDNPAGWHVPVFIINMLKEKEYQAYKEIRMPNGRTSPKAYQAKEFNIEVMDPLTAIEYKELGIRQRMAKGNLE